MLKNHDLQNKLVFLLVFFVLSFFFFKVNLKIDIQCNVLNTFLTIIGNFLIAIYIASIITTKQKNNELKINNCFKELDNLTEIINELRYSISQSVTTKLDDDITRYSSLISLQIQLINKYEYIKKEHKDKLIEYHRSLDKDLTYDNDINENYKMSLLQIERQILNIKSSIL